MLQNVYRCCIFDPTSKTNRKMKPNTGRKRIRWKCVVCGKESAGRVPRAGKHKGDLSEMFPRRHKNNGKDCQGNLEFAELIEINPK